MYFFLQIALSGLATGAIYGLIAVGYSLTFMTTRVLNFALGMWVMLGGMLTFSLIVQYAVPPLLTLPAVIVVLFALGVVAERFSVLPFLRAGSDVWVMSTLAVGLLMIDFVRDHLGPQSDARSFISWKSPCANWFAVHPAAAAFHNRRGLPCVCWARFFLPAHTDRQGVPRSCP